jgi:2-polyprenyl-3-methyl-5-hydroxy-6-metoxy-1,4-benzoquinol methylase
MSADPRPGVCRACGHGQLAPRLVANGCELVTCANCGYVQVLQVPSDEEIADIYRDAYFDKPKYVDDAAARHEFERRAGLLKDHGLQPDWRVLDYGCAGGDFVVGMEGRCNMWGVEYSREAIAKAAARHPQLAGRFGTLETVDGTKKFDAVTAWDVIEHVPSPPEMLARISRALKDGGVLVLSTPNIGAGMAKLMGRRWAFMTPPEHLGFFDKRSMISTLRTAGFEVEHWSTRGKLVNLPFLVHKASRVFPGLVPKRFGVWLAKSRFRHASLYVPTGDIQYVVARKVKEVAG